MSDSRPLFDEIVSLTGVARFLAAGMVTRALADAGVSVEEAGASHYEEALPRLRARLKAYLPAEQADARAQAILLHLARLQGTPARPTPSGLVRYRVKAQIAERARDDAQRADAEAAPPRSGELQLPAQVAASPSPRPVTPVHVAVESDDDEQDFTLVGRRWTADELAALRTAGAKKK